MKTNPFLLVPAGAALVTGLLAGCNADSQGANIIPVTNTSELDIDASDNPYSHSPDTRVGTLKAGATAMASCIVLVEGFPGSTAIRIDVEGEQGFVGLDSPGTKSTEGSRQISPDYATLVRELPECDS